MLRRGSGSNVLPAREPCSVVSNTRQAEHNTTKCHLPDSLVYNIYMYGSLARPTMGSGRPSMARAMVSAIGAQLPMESNVLLYAVARLGTGRHSASGYRRAQLHDIHLEHEPPRLTADATLLSMAMLGDIS